MRNQDYVSFEVAKLLQKRGFDYLTLFYYDKSGKVGMMNLCAQMQMRKRGYMNDVYPRPTVYEARDWIAQKCNTILLPDATWEYVDPDDMTNTEEVIRYSFMLFGEMHSEESYETMGEALNAGILYVLKDEDLWLRMELYCSEVKD